MWNALPTIQSDFRKSCLKSQPVWSHVAIPTVLVSIARFAVFSKLCYCFARKSLLSLAEVVGPSRPAEAWFVLIDFPSSVLTTSAIDNDH